MPLSLCFFMLTMQLARRKHKHRLKNVSMLLFIVEFFKKVSSTELTIFTEEAVDQ